MKVTLSAFDAQGRSTTKSFEGEATTVAQQITDMASLIPDFLAVSDLGTVKFSVSVETAETNAVGSAAANKDEGAVLRLALADGKQVSHRIPAPAKDINGVFNYITGGVVDTGHADIVAYIANFEALGAFTIQGQTVASVQSGYLED